ncbi:MAG: MFS transporter [Trueperaceae bacterium]|nr:MAG: MFS transporter [Trueperaceae bacterium]
MSLPETNPERARRAVLSIFLVNGIVLSSWVPHIPVVKERLGIGEGVLGLALLVMAAGAIIAMPVSGALTARFGSRAVTRISAIGFCVTLPLPVLAPSLAALAAGLFLFGALNGAMDVAMNSQGLEVEKALKRPVMSSFHALFSIGGLLGSGLGGLALSAAVLPWQHVALVIPLALSGAVYAGRSLVAGDGAGGSAPTFVRPKGAVAVLGLLAFFVLVGEGAMADWTAVYLRDSLGTGPGIAAAGFASFSGMMALGRLLGDRLVARLGTTALIRGSASLAVSGLAGGLLLSHPLAAVIGFGLVGLGLSNLIPVLFSAGGRVPGVHPGAGIAAVATAGYAGFLIGPPLIGLAAELVGLAVALWLVVVALALVAAAARAADIAPDQPSSSRG